MNEISDIIPKLPFYDKLTDPERLQILSGSMIHHENEGKLLHGYGECLGMIYVIRGIIRVYMVSEEGREITLFRLTEGEPCVMSASCVVSQLTFETQMTVEKECEIMIIPTSIFGRLTDTNIYVKCFMYELMTERFSSVMWTMQQILFARFDCRLASFFVREYERTGNCEIHMTHEQIATQINSAREVVARMVKRFQSDGLIEGRRGITILKNIEALKQLCR